MTDATELDEAAIRARLETATPGPWEVGDGWVYTLPVYEDDNRLSDVLGMKFADLDRQQQERARAQANAEFIAHARTDVGLLLTALDEARAQVERLHFDLDREARARQAAEQERDEARDQVEECLRAGEEWRRDAEAAERALEAVRALLDAEVADVVEVRVRSARGDVRCIDCNLRYEERQEYGCHESGRAHSYDEGDLAAAEEIERDEPVEYVTLPVVDLRKALAIPTTTEGDE